MKILIISKLHLLLAIILLLVCLGVSSCTKEAAVPPEERKGEVDLSLFVFKQIGEYRGTNIPPAGITPTGITNYQYVIDEKSLAVTCPNETVSNIYAMFHSHLGEADLVETNAQGEIDSFIYIPVGDVSINCARVDEDSSSTNGVKEVVFVIIRPSEKTELFQELSKGQQLHPKERKGEVDLSLFVFKQIGEYRGTNIPPASITPSGITNYLYVKDEEGFQVLCPNKTASSIYAMFQPSFGEPALLRTNAQGKINFFVYGWPGDITINCSERNEREHYASPGTYFVVLKPRAMN
jgi:hypothetical protein